MSPHTDLLLAESISADLGEPWVVCQILFMSVHFDWLLEENGGFFIFHFTGTKEVIKIFHFVFKKELIVLWRHDSLLL